MTDARTKRRELRLLQRESVWVQKAVFALNKADETDRKARETAGEDPAEDASIRVELEGGEVSFQVMREALEARVDALKVRSRQIRDEMVGM